MSFPAASGQFSSETQRIFISIVWVVGFRYTYLYGWRIENRNAAYKLASSCFFTALPNLRTPRIFILELTLI